MLVSTVWLNPKHLIMVYGHKEDNSAVEENMEMMKCNKERSFGGVKLGVL